jgi:hypothetical protein
MLLFVFEATSSEKWRTGALIEGQHLLASPGPGSGVIPLHTPVHMP